MEERNNNIFIAAGLVGIVLILVIAFVVQELKPKEYGGPITDTSWSIIDVQSLVDKGFSDKRFSDLGESIRQTSIILNPDCNAARKITGAKKKSESEYQATLQVCKKNYTLKLTDSVEEFGYDVYANGTQLLSYQSGSTPRVYPAKERLDFLLPRTMNLSNGEPATLTHFYEDYEIAVNSCGDNKIKEEAISAFKEWIEEVGFNSEEFDLVVPNRCDGE